jgi:hypothetical protein
MVPTEGCGCPSSTLIARGGVKVLWLEDGVIVSNDAFFLSFMMMMLLSLLECGPLWVGLESRPLI